MVNTHFWIWWFILRKGLYSLHHLKVTSQFWEVKTLMVGCFLFLKKKKKIGRAFIIEEDFHFLRVLPYRNHAQNYAHQKCTRLTIDLMIFSLPQEYQQIVDAEWEILYDKLDKIVKSGAKVVLSKLPIGDVATQYFADRLDFLLSYFLSEMHPSNTPCSRSILFTLISACIFSISVLSPFPKELTTIPLFSWPSSLI